nr:putative serine/threonine/dual specificity protein kinase, catalytic domain-containing protein [Tanacetum cinerariifolium]
MILMMHFSLEGWVWFGKVYKGTFDFWEGVDVAIKWSNLDSNQATSEFCVEIEMLSKLNICIGAARGLDYLHTGMGVESRVIHHDVKSSNVLLDEKLAAKISHFGVSRIGPANQLAHKLTRKSDVYAFGVVLLETSCGRHDLNFTLDEQ